MATDPTLDGLRTAPRGATYDPELRQKRAPADGAPVAQPSACLHEFFEAAALRWPDAVAVDVPPGRGRPQRTLVTYAELERMAEAIASHLRRLVAGECIVAILLPRDSALLYASQLAVLKAGAAYTCLDPAFPDERIHALLDDCAAAAVLTDAAGCARVRGEADAGHVLDARLLSRQAAPDPARAAPAWLTPASLAYVIYTSGTTGTPKGTLIEHRSIANLVASDRDEFGLGPGDRVAQHSSAVYDSSVEETWAALAVGAALVVMDDDAVRLGPDLVAWLRRERITVFCPTPTMLRASGCRDPETELPDLRLLYVGGEALPRDLAGRWARGRRLENGYGPTECTVTALRTWIHPDDEVSIGVPVPGNAAWVLDEASQPVADGEAGELCLGGVGLARGYHDRPELTAERFPVHPVLGRIYRTGDLAHRTPDGVFHYHGRLDSQVKLRGHRVELEEIEARLAQCDGVREAACRVQGTGASQVLAAFVVPERADAPPAEETLRAALGRTLPGHMVPARIGRLDSLPKTPGGKLDRRALPPLDVDGRGDGLPVVAPRNAVEARIAAAFAEVLGASAPVSVTHDFFLDLGGDSLSAAVAVSRLRDAPATAALTVRDLYDHRTAAGLAARIGERGTADDGDRAPGLVPDAGRDARVPRSRVRRPIAATLFQSAWLLKDLVIASLGSYAILFHVGPAVFGRLGVIPSLLLLPPLVLAALVAYTVLTVANAVWVKRRVIGRYEPTRVPVWGRYYLRHWVVERTAGLIPWWLLEGTEYQKTALRALGARIGQRVHIHRAVELRDGGWDLLDIGDDVTLAQGAAVRLIELEAGEMLVGPVVLGAGCTLDVQAGVRTDCRLEPDAYLTAHSSLPRGGRIPRGERWDGIPARPAGLAPPAPAVAGRVLSPRAAGDGLLLARLVLTMFIAIPAELLALGYWRAFGERLDLRAALAAMALAVLAVVLTLVMEALACRAMGRVRPGVVSRWSAAYVPIWLKPGLVDSAQRWLYGTLFWPYWLRLAGARVGSGCEISSLIDALPETIDVGARTFCADGIYLGGPRVHRGTVTIEPVSLGPDVFLGNGAVVPGGVRVPEGTLLGINTAADAGRLRPRTAWFGHPPFPLPRRRTVAADARLTDHPTAVRWATRLFWELARFSLPVVPVLAVVLYVRAIQWAESGAWWRLALAVPSVTLGATLLPALVALAAKWLLLGRVRPGVHPLWSCWSGRWDFYCVVWNVYVRELAGDLRGTALLAVLLRAVGVRVGRGVVLDGRFAEDLPDPDLLTIEDGATVEGAFQAHTFEDRVLKNGRVVIRAGATVGYGAVLLYGADVGAGARVAPHSVVMKHERLLPDGSYDGFPIHHVPRARGT